MNVNLPIRLVVADALRALERPIGSHQAFGRLVDATQMLRHPAVANLGLAIPVHLKLVS